MIITQTQDVSASIIVEDVLAKEAVMVAKMVKWVDKTGTKIVEDLKQKKSLLLTSVPFTLAALQLGWLLNESKEPR